MSAETVTPSEIRRRYEAGERDFRGCDIADDGDEASFRQACLDGSDFSHAFVVADFTGASLRACRFVEANVKTCSFDDADLRDSDFSRAAIDAATFRGARFDGACFEGASEHGHSLKPGELPTS
jgi:uncharacterized protein YjbI with pentapeptide repeats